MSAELSVLVKSLMIPAPDTATNLWWKRTSIVESEQSENEERKKLAAIVLKRENGSKRQ